MIRYMNIEEGIVAAPDQLFARELASAQETTLVSVKLKSDHMLLWPKPTTYTAIHSCHPAQETEEQKTPFPVSQGWHRGCDWHVSTF